MAEEPGSERSKRLPVRAVAARTDADERLVRLARALRQRLPGDARFGDPLSTAGERPVEVLGRQVSSLAPRRPSLAHEVGLGALQVWQAMSEASGRGRGEEDVALLFIDLVGFSSWALEAGDAAAVDLLRQVGVVVEEAVVAHGGAIVKRLGDGAMIAFAHPRDAVRAALEMQEVLATIDVASHRPRMRAGVHYGRPRRLGGDYLGVDVNVAARVGEAAGADEVLVSERACEMLEPDGFDLGKAKKLKAPGAPSDMRVRAVKR